MLISPGAAFINHVDSPGDFGVGGEWAEVRDGCYRVPCAVPPRRRPFWNWLSIGDWMAYKAPHPVLPPGDLFRASHSVIADWLRSDHITFVVASSTDDVDWVVFSLAERA